MADNELLAEAEYNAWQKIVHEWRNHPVLQQVDFNSDEAMPFVTAVEFWGETLVALRQTQTPEAVSYALVSKSRRYTERAT